MIFSHKSQDMMFLHGVFSWPLFGWLPLMKLEQKMISGCIPGIRKNRVMEKGHERVWSSILLRQEKFSATNVVECSKGWYVQGAEKVARNFAGTYGIDYDNISGQDKWRILRRLTKIKTDKTKLNHLSQAEILQRRMFELD